jgi:hypothetical protein
MDIVHLTNCNLVIGPPSDMQDGSCANLPVEVYKDEAGAVWSRSFWKPSPEDLATLNAGGVIDLHIRASGRQHPVVALGTAPLV